MYVSGVVEMEVKSTEEAYEMFYKGNEDINYEETSCYNGSHLETSFA